MSKTWILILTIAVSGLMATFAFYVYLFGYMNGNFEKAVDNTAGEVLGSTSITIGTSTQNNFALPDDVAFRKDPILNEEEKQKFEELTNPNQTYTIKIPKLAVETEVQHTNDLNALEEDIWIVVPDSYQNPNNWFDSVWPWSETLPNTEAVLLCYRRYYGASNPKSCYNLHKLAEGDTIEFDAQSYLVKKITVRPKDQKTLTLPNSNSKGYLRIISTSDATGTPEDSSHLIVVIAELAD